MIRPFSTVWRSSGGFTLLEVLVGLALGALIAGGVMGLISSSLQFSSRVKAKSRIQPILAAAAEEILAEPYKAHAGELTMNGFPDSPRVEIALVETPLPREREIKKDTEGLFRVQLRHQGEILEFSVIIREPESK